MPTCREKMSNAINCIMCEHTSTSYFCFRRFHLHTQTGHSIRAQIIAAATRTSVVSIRVDTRLGARIFASHTFIHICRSKICFDGISKFTMKLHFCPKEMKRNHLMLSINFLCKAEYNLGIIFLRIALGFFKDKICYSIGCVQVV